MQRQQPRALPNCSWILSHGNWERLIGHQVFVWIMEWRMCKCVILWWKQGMKGGGVLLLVLLPEIWKLKDSGGKCWGVYVIFSIVFYTMEDIGLLNVNNPIDLIALNLTFMPWINQALHEFMEAFNHHQLRTASHCSPYQMWVNGILNDANPLAYGD